MNITEALSLLPREHIESLMRIIADECNVESVRFDLGEHLQMEYDRRKAK